MKQKRFLESAAKPLKPIDAFFHVIPVPCEKTVSYGGGTAKGPAAIIEASSQIEPFDGFSEPYRLGIYTAPEVNCTGKIEKVIDNIDKAVSLSLAYNAFPVILGGEHSISEGVLRAMKRKYEDFGVVHFDAHADLKATYEGSPHSHACAMRHTVEMGIPLFQVGIRSLVVDEVNYRKEKKIPYIDGYDLGMKKLPGKILPSSFPKKVFFSIDVDGFDPSLFPATGTPEPGGFTWYQFTAIVENILKTRELIGFDFVELAPIKGMHSPDYCAARLIYNIMGYVQRQRKL